MKLWFSDNEKVLFEIYNLNSLPKLVQTKILDHKRSLMSIRYHDSEEICEAYIKEDFQILNKKGISKYLQSALIKCVASRLKTIEYHVNM